MDFLNGALERDKKDGVSTSVLALHFFFSITLSVNAMYGRGEGPQEEKKIKTDFSQQFRQQSSHS